MAQRSSAVVLDEAGARVVWRTWMLVPEWTGPRHHRPLLAGLLGFPWRTATLDARCLNRDPAPPVSGPFVRTVDRHHRRLPEPSCTCGIYAPLQDLGGPPPHVTPRRVTLAVGFARLSGRLVADTGVLRAQRAEVVGPLAILPARQPWWQASQPGPQRVVVGKDRYRVLWKAGLAGVPWDEWHAGIRHEIAARYGVRVVESGMAPARSDR